MIFEIAIALSTVFPFGYSLWKHQAAEQAERDLKRKLIENAPPEILSDTAMLVIELLKSDEGWSYTENSSPHAYIPRTYVTELQHKTGVILRFLQSAELGAYGVPYTIVNASVNILDDAGVKESVELNSYDEKQLKIEYDAYVARAKVARQKQLTKTLASRVIAAERGELQPILGAHKLPNPGEDGDSLGSEREASDSDTTGLLVYDDATRKVVQVGGTPDGRLTLSAALEARYLKKPKPPQTQKVYY